MPKITGGWWIGVAAGVAVGLGTLIAVESSTDEASAQQAVFRVSPQQLRINQRISQAAVRRSNESLQLLDPIRPRQNQPNKVLGWRTTDLRDGAVTREKLEQSLRESQPRWAVVQAGTGNLLRARGATAAAKLAPPGFYTVTFDRDISACAFQATIAPGDTAVTATGQVSAWVNPNAANTVTVRTAAVNEVSFETEDVNDRPFHLTVLC